MGLTLSHGTALDVLRSARIAMGEDGLSLTPCALIPPNPGQGQRWTDELVRRVKEAIGVPLNITLDILATDVKHRVRHHELRNHIWSADVRGLCFLELVHEQVAVPSPEILLAQMAEVLPLPDLAALGHELCGHYTLRPSYSRGSAVLDVPPLTSTAKIDDMLRHASRLRGSKALARALPYIQDSSLSAAETAFSVISQLPVRTLGYEIGRTILNREFVPNEADRACVLGESRIPDILFAGTSVGLNYDGDGHLSLAQLVRIAKALAGDPSSSELRAAVRQAMEDVRKEAASDKQRDRDLGVMGLSVLPVTRFDVEDAEGLDLVMSQVMTLIERDTGFDMSLQRQALQDEALRAKRYETFRRLFEK